MILTLTLNPAVDTCYYVKTFQVNASNRSQRYYKTAGGKGLNVSRVLQQLGASVVATGFLGGLTGQFIAKELQKMALHSAFVPIKEDTRNCLAIVDEQGQQTELLEAGPTISPQEREQFLSLLTDLIEQEAIKVLTISGSLPGGLQKDFYKSIVEKAKAKKILTLVDTSGEAFSEAIKASPYLIKPNLSELEELLSKKIESEEDAAQALQELQTFGIENSILSLGAQGSMARCGNALYRVQIPSVEVKSPVGSGDAMIAGMAWAILRQECYEEMLRIGSTCGVVNAMNNKTGTLDMEQFSTIYRQIVVKRLQ
ncbi:1-phosphofructokinase [Heliorestis convoluta]|uniref:Tagatose-6-phosphate kinase n=1 Tax=Heliorestis convoluta TaxID=356322 RepID=A0A5Q2MVL8_9FIRM|nr:1-phosphofructokinase [Heliorestis convoluta]QGG46237.1 1-phosphofructokinase [Heliorestis convoluta]